MSKERVRRLTLLDDKGHRNNSGDRHDKHRTQEDDGGGNQGLTAEPDGLVGLDLVAQLLEEDGGFLEGDAALELEETLLEGAKQLPGALAVLDVALTAHEGEVVLLPTELIVLVGGSGEDILILETGVAGDRLRGSGSLGTSSAVGVVLILLLGIDGGVVNVDELSRSRTMNSGSGGLGLSLNDGSGLGHVLQLDALLSRSVLLLGNVGHGVGVVLFGSRRSDYG